MTLSRSLERKFRFEMGRWLERSSLVRESFLSMGEIKACFRSDGMLDSLRQRLIRWVIAGSRASRQALSNLVGIKSRGQVESDMDIKIALTSVSVVGAKLEKSGGGDSGSM